MGYKISVKANEDLENIWLNTFANWSLEQADRYINLIFDEIEYASLHPNAGKDYTNIRKGYRCSKVRSYIIFYRLIDKQTEVEIIRVLHQRMDIENRLSE